MAPHEIEITDSTFEITTVHRQTNHRKPIDSILRVQGTEIVDGHGERVILKGVSFKIWKVESSEVSADPNSGWAWRTYEHGKLYHGLSRT